MPIQIHYMYHASHPPPENAVFEIEPVVREMIIKVVKSNHILGIEIQGTYS